MTTTMKRQEAKTILSMLLSLIFSTSIAANTETLPSYQKTNGISGNFSSVGSDSMTNLMTYWGEAFKQQYPSVNIQIQSAGSSTAPPALSAGTANVGPMSREMKDEEIARFEDKYNYAPTEIRVAIDALAVYVNKDNPITGLSLPEIDAIFSTNRKCGYSTDIRTWGQLGLKDKWEKAPIQLYGRNSVSGTYGYFKEHALCKGDYKNTVNEQPGSASVVQAVSNSPFAIGYSGIGFKTSAVRALPISVKKGGPLVAATAENAVQKTYPLSRFLMIYVNKNPQKPLPPLEKEFIRFVLSQQGQAITVKDGYIPLPANIAAKELAKIGA
jgi:phosphate transport system substrate-binding protein